MHSFKASVDIFRLINQLNGSWVTGHQSQRWPNSTQVIHVSLHIVEYCWLSGTQRSAEFGHERAICTSPSSIF